MLSPRYPSAHTAAQTSNQSRHTTCEKKQFRVVHSREPTSLRSSQFPDPVSSDSHDFSRRFERMLLDCPKLYVIVHASNLLEEYQRLVGEMTVHGANLPELYLECLGCIESLRFLSWNYFEDHPAITEQLDRLQTQAARFVAAIESLQRPAGVCAYCSNPFRAGDDACWECKWDFFGPAVWALGRLSGGFWTQAI